MANYSIKQNNSQSQSGGFSSGACIYTSAQTAGSINVVTIGWEAASGTITSVVDTINGTYTAAGAIATSNQAGAIDSTVVYYFPNIAACSASANTVTATFSGSFANPDLRISEFSSTNGSTWSVDKQVGAQWTGTAATSGNTAATVHANDLIYGACMTGFGIQSYGSGFTGIVNTGAGADEWKEVVATGAQAATFTDASTGGGSCIVVAFNAAVSPVLAVNPRTYGF